MCGNGTRAVAHYANSKKIIGNFTKFLTGVGDISCTIDANIVETQMTPPKEIKSTFEQYGLKWWLVDTGVPHLVTVVDNISKFDKNIASKMRYEYNANVNYMAIKDNNKLYVRTYERGVEDETQACGTGMVACFLRANHLNLISNEVKVYPTSLEELTIREKNDTVYFKGKVKLIKEV